MPEHHLVDPDSFELELVARKFHALGHPIRLRMALLLVQQEQSVKDLTERIAWCNQSNISQHLAVMREQSMVDSEYKDGRMVYWITDPVLKDWISILFAAWSGNRALLDLEAAD